MSDIDILAAMPWKWVLVSGALGGTLNAAFSNNLRLLPTWSLDARGVGISRVIRVGLLVSSTVGAAASVGLIYALPGVANFDLRPGEVPFRLVIATLVVGFVTARGLTSEVDKVLLRMAVRNAAAAPAAHPEIAQAIDHAPPYAVYRMAVDLAPRRRRSPTPLPVGPGFEKAHPQRS